MFGSLRSTCAEFSSALHIVLLRYKWQLGGFAFELVSIAKLHLRRAIALSHRSVDLNLFAFHPANVTHITQIVGINHYAERTTRSCLAEMKNVHAGSFAFNLINFSRDANMIAYAIG